MGRQLAIKNKRVYIRLIISYLIVFMIPMLMNLVMLEKISGSIQKEISENVLLSLNNAREQVDDSIAEIDSIVEKLTGNLTVRYIFGQMDEQDKLIEVSKIKTVRDFMKLLQIETFVEEYYLYFHKSDMIVSPKHIYLDADKLAYDFEFGQMSWKDWKDAMHEGYNGYFFAEQSSRQMYVSADRILYVQSMVNNYGVKGNFIFPIKSEKIKGLLEDAYVSKSGWGYVVDKDGKVLLMVPSEDGICELADHRLLTGAEEIQEIELAGQQVEVIQSISQETGLRFVAVLPKEYIATQINYAQKQNVQIILLVLLGGLACVLGVSWYRGKKIDDILKMLLELDSVKEESVKGDEFSYISHSLKHLIDHNEDLKDHILRQRPVTRSLLLERLLWGGRIQK